jgi:hypothetical protein
VDVSAARSLTPLCAQKRSSNIVVPVNNTLVESVRILFTASSGYWLRLIDVLLVPPTAGC